MEGFFLPKDALNTLKILPPFFGENIFGKQRHSPNGFLQSPAILKTSRLSTESPRRPTVFAGASITVYIVLLLLTSANSNGHKKLNNEGGLQMDILMLACILLSAFAIRLLIRFCDRQIQK